MPMRTPPFYLAAAVMFWAWHEGVLVLGAAMALVLEAPRLVRARWRFEQGDFARIADLCTWAFVILAGYLTFTHGMPVPILEILRWLPLAALPLMLAQLFSEAGRVPLRAMFVSLRLKRYAKFEDPGADLGYPYAIFCVLAAGAANLRQPTYYVGLALLAGWALWRVRPARYPWYVWMVMFAGVTAIGYAGELGLNRLQQIVIDSTQSMFSSGRRTDPYRSTTDIGEIGELKQSAAIVLRVTVPPGARIPLLLRTAGYNVYSTPSWTGHPAWFALDSNFVSVPVQADGGSWMLASASAVRDAMQSFTVSQPVQYGKAVLALPNGTVKIGQLPALAMQINPLGTVEIDSHEDIAKFQAAFDPSAAAREPPKPDDLRLPHNEQAMLDEISARLQLKGMPAEQVLATLRNYFLHEFRYSTYLSMRRSKQTPLADFLLVTHAGHCEYFATATTLLLRAAGIPARYATGFSIQEWSPLEGRYIARERHAHAWAQAWVGGRWQDFDTTPPVWFAAEAEGSPQLQKISDVWSWMVFRFEEWEAEEPNARTITALILVLPLTAILIWRLLIQEPLAIRRANRRSAIEKRGQPGADSEFYEIEKRLTALGCPRAADESLAAWLLRVGSERADIAVAPLLDLLRLHYRYRFDPLGLNAEERRTLGSQVRQWLAAHRSLARLQSGK